MQPYNYQSQMTILTTAQSTNRYYHGQTKRGWYRGKQEWELKE